MFIGLRRSGSRVSGLKFSVLGLIGFRVGFSRPRWLRLNIAQCRYIDFRAQCGYCIYIYLHIHALTYRPKDCRWWFGRFRV